MKLVFIGLEDSGKTSLLHILKDKRLSQVVSNKYPQPEECVMDNIRYRIFDLSGHQSARKLWREYIMHVNAIVFLVDSADRDRFHIAREELHELLNLALVTKERRQAATVAAQPGDLAG